jgi:hypothetical protein
MSASSKLYLFIAINCWPAHQVGSSHNKLIPSLSLLERSSCVHSCHILSLLLLFWKNESRLMPSVSLCVCESPLTTSKWLNQSLWNLVCISRHLSPSQRCTYYIPPISLCLYMYTLWLLGNGSVKTLLRQRICPRVVLNVMRKIPPSYK